MAELTSLRNIGKRMEQRLKAVDISTAEELKEIGSKKAFLKLKAYDPGVCTVYLYTLEGAITDIEYNQLPNDIKQDLKIFGDSFK